MSWSVGYDDRWKRDIGYGVPSMCDHPGCQTEINRGLGYVCCDEQPYGGLGCGLYFCGKHLAYYSDDGFGPCCQRCVENKHPFLPTPDTAEWIDHKLTDESWREWREQQGQDWLKQVRLSGVIDLGS